MFKPMKTEALSRIVEDLKEDTFVKESIQVIPDEVLATLGDADENFLQGYITGMSYDMHSISRVHTAMAEGNIAEAMQLKQFSNTILYLLSKRLVDPDFDFIALKKESMPEKGKLIIPGVDRDE